MHSKTIILVLLLGFVGLGTDLLICLISSSIRYFYALLPPSLLFAYFANLLLSANRHAYCKKKQDDELFDMLKKASFYMQRGFPFLASLNEVLAGSSDNSAKSTLRKLAREIYLGLGIDQALASIGHVVSAGSIDQAIAAYDLSTNRKQAELEGTVQTYTTLNMFIAVIVPAFLMFAFVGTSIISPTSRNMLPLALLLIIAVPIVYALGNLALNRRFYA